MERPKVLYAYLFLFSIRGEVSSAHLGEDNARMTILRDDRRDGESTCLQCLRMPIVYIRRRVLMATSTPCRCNTILRATGLSACQFSVGRFEVDASRASTLLKLCEIVLESVFNLC